MVQIATRILLSVTVLSFMLAFLSGCETHTELPPPVPALEVVPDTTVVVEPPPKMHDLQPVIDQWVATQKGLAGVMVYDLQNQKCIGRHNADTSFFSASIYKLFVAYGGYLAIQNGGIEGEHTSHSGHTREECLDAMIRSSESLCAQTILSRLGKDVVSDKLLKYGMTHTSLNALTTSAQDVMLFLKHVFETEELSDVNKQKLLDSMKDQPLRYRSGLPRGFANATVYNKVGWNENKEWHDAAIVTLENGESYVVVVLTQGVGGRRVIELARRMSQELLS